MSSDLAHALVASLDDDARRTLARQLAPYLRDELRDAFAAREDRWMNAREAAAHIGRSIDALHRLTAERRIPFRQDGPNAKLWFRESELDAWLETQRIAPRS